ncbi:MAG: carboxypeptidase-like regulatory domain-containing protein [Pyrinomonadaceae bacterium]
MSRIHSAACVSYLSAPIHTLVLVAILFTTLIQVPIVVSSQSMARVKTNDTQKSFGALPVEVLATGGDTQQTYVNVSDAVAAINLGSHTGVITISISGNTIEPGPVVINSSGILSASFESIVIFPAADDVTMSGSSGAGRGLIELNGADNVTIDGDNPNNSSIDRNLSIQNTAVAASTNTAVLRLAFNMTADAVSTTADNCVFKNLNLIGSMNTGNNAAETSTSGSENNTFGIYAGGGASATAAPSPISNTEFGPPASALNFSVQNNRIMSAARGVATLASSGTVFQGLSIRRNLIGNPAEGMPDGIYSVGIYVRGSNTAEITGNEIYVEGYVGSTASPFSNCGISVGSTSVGTSNALIEDNRINRVRNNHPQGHNANGINIASHSSETGHTVRNNFVSGISNNQVTGGGSFAISHGAFGIRIWAGNSHKIYHNSVNLFGSIPGEQNQNLTAAFALNGTSSVNVDVRNNIFSNQLSGGNSTSTRHAAVYLPSSAVSGMNLTLNHNSYHQAPVTVTNSRLAQVGLIVGSGEYLASNFDASSTGDPANFRTYTANLEGNATNDNASSALNSPPPFVSESDLHIVLNPLALIENGGANLGVPDDIDGEMRDTASPDIGADEIFAPTAAGLSISGRVITSHGRGIRNAFVTISGRNLITPISTVTGTFGFYNFEGLPAGNTYVVTVGARRFTIREPSRSITPFDNVSGMNFVAEP